MEGEVNRLGVRAIEAERRGGGRLDEDARKEKGMRTRSLQSSRTDKARTKGDVRRRSRRVEVAGAVTVAGMASGCAQWRTGNNSAHLTDFDPCLIAQNSNFRIAT